MKLNTLAALLGVVFVAALLPCGSLRAQQDTIVLKQALALPLPKGYADVVVAPNPVEATLAVSGSLTALAPAAGRTVQWRPGERLEWRAISADAKGWFTDSVLAGCYVCSSVEMKSRGVMILQAMGDEVACVNGSPRAGNPYCLKDERESWEPGFDYSFLPVMLEKGANELVFRCVRERLKVRLYSSAKPVFFNTRDMTIPDFVAGEGIDTWGAIVVVNASTEPLRDLLIQASIPGAGAQAAPQPVPIIQPLSVRKVGFRLTAAGSMATGGTIDVIIKLTRKGSGAKGMTQKGGGADDAIDRAVVPFRVVGPYENRKETFISDIDGSVQYYAINPAQRLAGEMPAALFLTLHGASVEAVNQSASYEPKSWGHVVAPTNRRPYGFNWEEWGRLDALEVLNIVKQRYRIDENRIYLTGHSMGGHGVWHIGSLFPDQFAAIGPSAGWISFWTYRFRGIDLGDTTAVRRMLRRSTTPSETFMHVRNYAGLGVYILHGAADDNVPVTEARSMADSLRTFHRDFVYHEQPLVGHWWDVSDEPGVDCVDWAPMFDFFARHARPLKERVREIHFLTSNPGVSARDWWLAIDAQERPLEMSSADVRFDPGKNRFTGTTGNVARLAFDLDIARAGEPVAIELDGQKLSHRPMSTDEKQLWLERRGGVWEVASEPSADLKGARRYGTFKDAFRNRPVLVFGTKGTREENAWAFDKARFDAEKLWYQGNASIDVVRDVDFDPLAEPGRNVILYGNATTNAAWKTLLSKGPVQVGKAKLRIGGAGAAPPGGASYGCLFIRPRPGSPAACVGVVSGTDLAGMRLANRIPYLSPGINLPDLTVLDQ
ncbi:MAG: prolyl oligopeptidase family serine peptidase, partial [Candidatus Krumholzibacteriaceae bacterium]